MTSTNTAHLLYCNPPNGNLTQDHSDNYDYYSKYVFNNFNFSSLIENAVQKENSNQDFEIFKLNGNVKSLSSANGNATKTIEVNDWDDVLTQFQSKNIKFTQEGLYYLGDAIDYHEEVRQDALDTEEDFKKYLVFLNEKAGEELFTPSEIGKMMAGPFKAQLILEKIKDHDNLFSNEDNLIKDARAKYYNYYKAREYSNQTKSMVKRWVKAGLEGKFFGHKSGFVAGLIEQGNIADIIFLLNSQSIKFDKYRMSELRKNSVWFENKKNIYLAKRKELEELLMTLNEKGQAPVFDPSFLDELLNSPHELTGRSFEQAHNYDIFINKLKKKTNDAKPLSTEEYQSDLKMLYFYYGQALKDLFREQEHFATYINGNIQNWRNTFKYNKGGSNWYNKHKDKINTDERPLKILIENPIKTGVALGVGALGLGFPVYALLKKEKHFKKEDETNEDPLVSHLTSLVHHLVHRLTHYLYDYIEVRTKSRGRMMKIPKDIFCSFFPQLNSAEDPLFTTLLDSYSIQSFYMQDNTDLPAEDYTMIVHEAENVLKHIKIYQGQLTFDAVNQAVPFLPENPPALDRYYMQLIDNDSMLANVDKIMLKKIIFMALADLYKFHEIDNFDDQELLILEVLKRQSLKGTSIEARSRGILRPVRFDD